MAVYTDQLNRTIHLTQTPKRIVSLVPSQTELLFDLGLNDEVVGITKFCVHPPIWFNTKTRIGGTKNINIQKIQSLLPDLIIANKEENVKEQIEALTAVAPVFISDVNNIADALEMIDLIGAITNQINQSKKIIENIAAGFSQLKTQNLPLTNCCYLIWKDPYMSVGGDTFINAMLQTCGLKNIFEAQQRYPEINLQQLVTNDCKLILLSSEPYPFKQKHIAEMQTQLTNATIMLVDGEMFSWYGSRMLYATKYFQELIKNIIC